MKTKILYLSTIVFLLTVFDLHSQNRVNNNRSERVESMKIAFLSRNLNLTPDEAILFWPVYNELHENIQLLQRDYKIKERQLKGGDEATARELITLNINKEQNKLDLQKQYYEKLINIITARKVILLHQAEEQFRKELLKEIRKRNG